jgi:hypothetical protein
MAEAERWVADTVRWVAEAERWVADGHIEPATAMVFEIGVAEGFF